jgi:hypothetical protein
MSTTRTIVLSVALTLVVVIAAYFAFYAVSAHAASASSGAANVHMYTNEYLRQWAQQNALAQEGIRQIGLPR